MPALSRPARASILALAVLSLIATLPSHADTRTTSIGKAPQPAATAKVSPDGLEALSGVWIEGPGYRVTYGMTYETCARQCLEADRCRMIEFYKPERKCNLYDNVRPRKQGGSSIVGIRRGLVRADVPAKRT